MSGGHDHHHDHGSEHPGIHPDVDLPEPARRAIAMHELLVEKGVLDPGELAEQIQRVRSRSAADGARVVARAWVEPAFKARLLRDARSAVAELGYTLTHDAELAVVEHRCRAPSGRVHPLLLLSDRSARTAAGLVQEQPVPAARGRPAAGGHA